MLKLSAKILERTSTHAWIQLFRDGDGIGSTLCVNAAHADELVALLNTATETLGMLRELAQVRDCLYLRFRATPHEDCVCLRCAAYRILAKAEGAT